MGSHWTHKFFIEADELFLRIMNERWTVAETEAEAIAKLLKKQGLEKGKILDLMCGNGRISINLAKFGYKVVGIDISPAYIEDARRKAKEHEVEENVKFLVGDVRELDKKIKDEGNFDGVINNWTSVGYYDESTDQLIFSKARKLTKKGGILIIANCASRDFQIKIFQPKIWEKFGNLIVLHENEFNYQTSKLKSTWHFFEQENNDLKSLKKLGLELRLYSIHELIAILRKAGWETIETYKNIITLEPFDPLGPINIVAKAI
ncbi:MAG: class I SAM-dependent methyltransferase [Candidatus Baldrarchaeota archaeon]